MTTQTFTGSATTAHAIAAFVAANTPLDPARYGEPELRARCANCNQAHPTWRCPEIGVALHAPEDDASDIQGVLDKDAEIAAMRQQIERLQGHARYVWSQLRGAYAREAAAREALATADAHIGALVAGIEIFHPFTAIDGRRVDNALTYALSAARAWLRREAK